MEGHSFQIDHFVLTVRDIQATCAFYENVLGIATRFGHGRVALQIGDQKINLHEAGREFEPKAAVPMPGAGDFCLLTGRPLAEIAEHIRSYGVAIEEGPVRRTGARGQISSIYLRDPDGNLVEIANSVTVEEE